MRDLRGGGVWGMYQVERKRAAAIIHAVVRSVSTGDLNSIRPATDVLLNPLNYLPPSVASSFDW